LYGIGEEEEEEEEEEEKRRRKKDSLNFFSESGLHTVTLR